MKELSDSLYTEIKLLCEKGDMLAKSDQLEEAKAQYLSALKLLPGDRNEWEAATWIYVAIGDVHFKLKNYDKCFKCFYNAVQCPKGLANSFI